MLDINGYILSRKTRSFTSKLGLWELIIDRHRLMGPVNTREDTIVTINIQNLGITRDHSLKRRVPYLPLWEKI